MKVPLDLTKVFQGILLFYVLACDSLILYRIRLMRSVRKPAMALLEAIILSVIAASTPLCWRRPANSSSSAPACSISASRA